MSRLATTRDVRRSRVQQSIAPVDRRSQVPATNNHLLCRSRTHRQSTGHRVKKQVETDLLIGASKDEVFLWGDPLYKFGQVLRKPDVFDRGSHWQTAYILLLSNREIGGMYDNHKHRDQNLHEP